MQRVEESVRRLWGYGELRPLQREAMECVIAHRDSVVVLPTGGGKSLCFQAPATVLDGVGVVVSPLLALMKDQVDALAACGVKAGRIDSTQDEAERSAVVEALRGGRLELLYVSPERLMTNGFLDLLESSNVAFFAIDESHCISMWGHDFRPEYRQLGGLKERFPNAAVHAYTATATEQVRDDIIQGLALHNPQVLVGSFFRSNLIYRVSRRHDLLAQVREVIGRHPGGAGIVYCIRRDDVNKLAGQLREAGISALPYHAGLEDDLRRRHHEMFIRDEIRVMVATVAFGMGIDKPDVRFVIHAAPPKSLEHYQQETGRAGRDGLEAECVLLHSAGDFNRWRRVMEETGDEDARRVAFGKLRDMNAYCAGVRCRHERLLSYFGQSTERGNCGACDVCLDGVTQIDGALETAQKILSCVRRMGERFGMLQTVHVLRGSKAQRILDLGHDRLSTFGLLSNETVDQVRDWMEQLVGQEYLQTVGEYSVLRVTPSGWRVIRGEETPILTQTAQWSPRRHTQQEEESLEGINDTLFETLRSLRLRIARDMGIPPYMVFPDRTLREMARARPTTKAKLLALNGVGEQKAEMFGDAFLQAIVTQH